MQGGVTVVLGKKSTFWNHACMKIALKPVGLQVVCCFRVHRFSVLKIRNIIKINYQLHQDQKL